MEFTRAGFIPSIRSAGLAVVEDRVTGSFKLLRPDSLPRTNHSLPIGFIQQAIDEPEALPPQPIARRKFSKAARADQRVANKRARKSRIRNRR